MTASDADMPPPAVRIIGGGLSGLVLGQCLLRRNIPAIIYEKSKENPTRNNYGITIESNVWEKLYTALPMDTEYLEQRVAVVHPSTAARIDTGQSIRVNKAALMRALQDRLDIRWDAQIRRLSSNTGDRQLSADAGQSEIGPGIVVGADGVHSTVRETLGLKPSAFETKTLPYVVFNGKRRLPFDDLENGLQKCFDHPDGIVHLQGTARLSIKADFWDAEKDMAGISYTLSRPATGNDDALLKRSVRDAEALASRFADEVGALDQLPEPFLQAFDVEAMKNDRLLHWLMRSSLLEDVPKPHSPMWRGVALMGDAVHAQPIVGGRGANTAILDALELAKHVRSADYMGTAAYVHARVEAWREDQAKAEQAIHELHASDAGGKTML